MTLIQLLGWLHLHLVAQELLVQVEELGLRQYTEMFLIDFMEELAVEVEAQVAQGEP